MMSSAFIWTTIMLVPDKLTDELRLPLFTYLFNVTEKQVFQLFRLNHNMPLICGSCMNQFLVFVQSFLSKMLSTEPMGVVIWRFLNKWPETKLFTYSTCDLHFSTLILSFFKEERLKVDITSNDSESRQVVIGANYFKDKNKSNFGDHLHKLNNWNFNDLTRKKNLSIRISQLLLLESSECGAIESNNSLRLDFSCCG